MKTFTTLIFITLITAAAFAGTAVQYSSGSEKISGYLAEPKGNGPFPAIVVIHEWWGLNDQIRGLADKLAAQGYVALAADLYRGKTATTSEDAHQYMSGLPEDRAIRDLKASVDHLSSMKSVQKDNIGVIGWCMGGKYSFLLASNDPRIAAAVIYYGSVPTDPENLKNVKAPIIGFFGETDKAVTPDMAKKFEEQMKALKKDVAVHVYPGAGHAFMNEKGQSYHAEAAKDSWTKALAFLEKHLKDGSHAGH